MLIRVPVMARAPPIISGSDFRYFISAFRYTRIGERSQSSCGFAIVVTRLIVHVSVFELFVVRSFVSPLLRCGTPPVHRKKATCTPENSISEGGRRGCASHWLASEAIAWLRLS